MAGQKELVEERVQETQEHVQDRGTAAEPLQWGFSQGSC